MNVKIYPSVAKGSIHPPPSKSCAHRLLICSALSKGESVIENIGINEDISATARCLRVLGAEINIENSIARVKGIDFKDRVEQISLFCNESGSTLRFLIPLSLIFSKKAFFEGRGRLLQRPQAVYERLFEEKGCSLLNEDGCLAAEGQLKSGVYSLRGDVSSQFITGLLFALPLLSGDSEIRLTSALESAPYIDITLDVLHQFGIVINKNASGYFIKGSQEYRASAFSVEGDYSNSAFLHGFNLLGGSVKVEGLNPQSFQGDRIYTEYFEKIKNGSPVLDISDCPDLGPVLISLCALTNGGILKGTKRLKIKESDRAEAMKTELLKFGVNISVFEDEIHIPKSKIQPPEEIIRCHNDHRIAMALALVLSTVGGELEDAQCINKSYPEFFTDIESLGINLKIITASEEMF